MYPEMSMLDIKRTTIADYEVMVESYKLAKIDREFDIHLLAWQSVQAGTTNDKGKPNYKTFDKFYDYEKRIKEIKNDEAKVNDETKSFFNMLKKINQGGD